MKHASAAALALLAMPVLCSAVVIGQTDTFEDGSTLNWTVALGPGGASPAPGLLPANATGGPAGPDDNYLLLNSAGGSGAGSRLSVMNVNQWAGDYIAAGINMIAMDVRNFGGTSLALRLALENLGAMGPTDIAFSTDPVLLPANSGWTTIVFPVGPASLSAVPGGTVLGALAGVDVLRIYHSLTATFPPPNSDAIAATLGVDNITTVPEPSSLALAAGALAALGLKRRYMRG